MTSDSVAVALSRSEAILAVADMAATVRFYRDKLSFTGDWLWGDPPTFGGVSWGADGWASPTAGEAARWSNSVRWSRAVLARAWRGRG